MSWQLSNPTDAKWVTVNGRTYGGVETDPVYTIPALVPGPVSFGGVSTDPLLSFPAGSEGPLTKGDAITYPVAPPVKVLETTTQGNVLTSGTIVGATVLETVTQGDVITSPTIPAPAVLTTSTQGNAQTTGVAPVVVGNEGASTQGSLNTDPVSPVTEGNQGASTEGSYISNTKPIESFGGLPTPLYSFSEDRRSATAIDGTGEGPSTYQHATSFSGSDLRLTTSELT